MRTFRWIFCLAILTSSYLANAQVKLGITGGAVFSSLIRDSHLSAYDGNFGYMIGGMAKLNIGELGWMVQSGVQYTLEGDHIQPLNFLKVPLILGFEPSENMNIHVAYNLSWQVGDKNGVQDFYKNFASILGLGFEIYISEKVSLGSRLNYGLSNLVSVPAEAKNYVVKPFTLDLFLTYYIN